MTFSIALAVLVMLAALFIKKETWMRLWDALQSDGGYSEDDEMDGTGCE